MNAGSRSRDLYQNDGIHYMTRRPDEMLTERRAVPAEAGWRSTYWKLRRRGSFDFPVLSVAAALRLGAEGTVADGAHRARRRGLTADGRAEGRGRARRRALTDAAIADAADGAYDVAKPMDNTDFDLVWRKRMSRVLVGHALRELRGDDMRETRVKLARQALTVVS